MTRDRVSRRGATYALIVLAAALVCCLAAGFQAVPAYAADDARGQLTIGAPADEAADPLSVQSDVPITKSIRDVEMTGDVSVIAAIDNDNNLWMWGQDDFNVIPDGIAEQDATTPVKVLDNVSSVALDTFHGGAIKADGSLWMWGQYAGNGSSDDQLIPVKVLDNVKQVALGNFFTLALRNDGSVWSWGSMTALGSKYTYVPAKIMDGVVSVAACDDTAAALKSDGSLFVWGSNYHGQVGNGTSGPSNSVLTPYKALEGVSSVVVDGSRVGAIKKDGSLWMWGNGQYGQIGNGGLEDVTTPTKVLEDVSSASLGNSLMTVALKNDGSVWAWGEGIIGDGEYHNSYRGTTATSPVCVLNGISRVVAGGDGVLALTSGGDMWAWGGFSDFDDGGWNWRNYYSPHLVRTGVADIAVGFLTSAYLRTDGSLWTWGHNADGEVGNGTTDPIYSPVMIFGSDGSTPGMPPAPLPMYRLYNQYSGEHFYTASAAERDDVVAAGWTDEGVGWTAPPSGDAVYRVYNPYAGEHHYTLDAGERDGLVAGGWVDEGVGWYSYTDKTTPLYREYNPNMFSCNHNYTSSESEHNHLVSLGWVDEGIAWYGI